MSRLARATRIAGALLLLGSIPESPRAQAQEADTFGGYEAAASGAALSAAPFVPAVLPVESPFEATLSLAFASLSSGGLGFGRASSVWPGTPLVGIRPLIEIASGERLPIPDYPIVVESREHEGAKHDDISGITMETDVGPERARATSGSGGLTIPAVIQIDSVETTSTVVLDAERITSSAVTEVDGIDLTAGVIQIDSVKTTSTASSDAHTSTCDGSVIVTGATVSGTPVTIDEKGVHAQGSTIVPGVDPNDAVATALAAAGVTVRTIGGIGRCDGVSASRSTTGLLVSVPLPGAAAVPPGGHLDFVIGSTSATASANLPFEFAPPSTPLPQPPSVGDVIPPSPGGLDSGALPDPVSPDVPRPAVLSPIEPLSHHWGGVPVLVVGLFLFLAVPGARIVRRYVLRISGLSTAP